ncbi:hypothetical protein FRC00_004759 [Tulasnella sp. 408]|nr:hypothetical protein FRC00_004759 [Tulasnella sp. 408]
MSFFFRPAFYPERPVYSSSRAPVSDDEAYYRRVAEEHQRRAQAALALAQEEERRRRQATAPRSYHDEPHFRPEYRPEYIPTRPHYSYAPYEFPFDSYEPQHPPRYEHLPDVAQRSSSPVPRSREQAMRDDHERRIDEWLQRRRQRDLEEAEFRRLKELERRRDDEMMREMLAALGIDSMERTRATPTNTSLLRPTTREVEEDFDATSAPRQVPAHSQTYPYGRHIPSPQPAQTSEPASTPTTSPSPDFPTQLWNALSGGRSDEERASILRDLGLGVPFNVARAPNTRHPAAEQRPAPASQRTAAPRSFAPQPQVQTPRPTPARIPVIVRSPAPATPQPKPSSESRNSSPAPVKLSPFAHIESIQTKFDSLRASTPDLSNPQKKREYLAELNKLLTSLDAVESSGSESIRGARKALVRAVEEELENVESHQDEQKREVAEEKQVEEVKVEAKEEEKPSAEPVAQDVEIQSVTESEPIQVHPAEPTVEEPADEPANAAAEHAETESHSSFEHVPAEDEAHPEAQTTLPAETVSASSDDAKPAAHAEEAKTQETREVTEEEPQRGRQPAVASQSPKSPTTRRPRSVEIEEVPDEESLGGSPRVGQKDL